MWLGKKSAASFKLPQIFNSSPFLQYKGLFDNKKCNTALWIVLAAGGKNFFSFCSVSFNKKYKDVWKVKKEGGFISLASVTEDQKASEQEED